MNNKKICLLFSVTAVISLHAFAQKKQFTIMEATNGMSTTLAPKSVKNASWQPGTDNLWQTEKKGENDVWKVINFSENKDNVQYVEQGNYPEKVTAIPAVKWISKNEVYFVNGKDVIDGRLSANKFTWSKMVTLPDSADHITVDKSGQVAYTIANNLWVWSKEFGYESLSEDKDRNIISGQPVHRDEFGIDKGIFFSPKGKYAAFYRMDQTMVKDYPIIRWDTTPAIADIIKYPMAGGTSHQVRLYVTELKDRRLQKTREGMIDPMIITPMQTMNDGEKDHYLTCVSWSPDEKYIYVALLNRDQNHLWLNKYNAKTGDKIKTLFEETNKKYVHPMHPLTFLPGGDNKFIWWSERDGYDHLYLYNSDGKLIRQVTKGKWVVNEIAGIDAAGDKLIITASKESPLEKHIYSVGINNGVMERIDKGAGMHSALCSEDGRYVLDVYSGTGTPKNTYVRATNGDFSKELIKAPNTLADYDRPEIRDITITAADGVTPLYGKLILPTNFDSNKKYPVIVYLYNGPNVQLIHNSFPESGNLWYEYMAQHGYIVFTMDGRGSWNRGLAFEQATFRKLGDAEMADQLKGVDYLKSLRYVDADRMGVHGWSYGGFMTTSLMLKHPGVFKCAVAGGSVMDWKMYEVMYTERYMDTPGDNPEGYENANLLDKVKNLQGKLLLIHGTNDNTVVWQNSIDFLKKCVDEGVQVDYFVYPGYEHNVRGKDRAHLMQKISSYFDDYLKR